MVLRKWLSLFFVVAVMIGMCVPVARAADVLEITAESALLADADSGKVLYEKDADKRLAPASMTKLMTLVLAVRLCGMTG